MQPYLVMTVCTGNICRSPMAEVVLADRFEAAGLGERVVVDSTGISDEEHGRPIDRRAARVLAAHGYDVPARAARRVTRADVDRADLLLPMTASHARALRALAGALAGAHDGAAHRIRLLRSFDPAASAGGPEHLLDVDDPWYGDEAGFEVTLAEIEAAADGVVAHVRAELAARGAAPYA